MSECDRSFRVRRVSSAPIASTSVSIRTTRGDASSRLPIGVATKYTLGSAGCVTGKVYHTAPPLCNLPPALGAWCKRCDVFRGRAASRDRSERAADDSPGLQPGATRTHTTRAEDAQEIRRRVRTPRCAAGRRPECAIRAGYPPVLRPLADATASPAPPRRGLHSAVSVGCMRMSERQH